MAEEAVSVTLCLGPLSVPTGVLELVLATTVRMSSSEMLRAAAATGSTCTRTANFCAPNTSTWATPRSCEICCASVISPNSLTADRGRVGDTKLIYMIGKSPGFTLRKLGGDVISTGRGIQVVERFTCYDRTFGCCITTYVPLDSRRRPCTTTLSPPSSPRARTDSLPRTRAIWTGSTIAASHLTTKTYDPVGLTCT